MTVESASIKQATSRQAATSNSSAPNFNHSSKSSQAASKLPLSNVKRQRPTSISSGSTTTPAAAAASTNNSNTKSPDRKASKQTSAPEKIASNDTNATTVLTTTSTTLLKKPSSENGSHQQLQLQSQSAKDLQLLTEEAQDLKTKSRKLLLEIDEKNEIINVLKDELETLREQSDKFQRENIQLVKDAKRVKFLQDENDFLQDKVGQVDVLELEIKRLKEKLNETEFFKLRIGELEEDLTKSQEESQEFENKWIKAESKLTRVAELEQELIKWKSFSHDLEQEKNSIQGKLLESIDQGAKLDSVNKKVEDEVRRLRDLVKSYEEQRDEEQASNSLMSVSDLKQLDQQEQEETSIKLEKLTESHKQIEDELRANKEMISELRQDLACEKSLAQRLTNQLATFTKQIKSLDKQYFPIHDISNSGNSGSTSTTKATPMVNNKQPSGQEQAANRSNLVDNARRKYEDQRQQQATKPLVATATVPPTPTQTEQDKVPKSCVPRSIAVSYEQSPAVTINISGNFPTTDRSTNDPKESLQQKQLPAPIIVDGSHQQDQPAKQIVTTTPSAESTSNPLPSSNSNTGINKNKSSVHIDSNRRDGNQQQSASINDNHIAEDDGDNDKNELSEGSDVEFLDAGSKAKPSALIKSQQRSENRGNFVRNSLPSRSVNFGHARSSAYLDKIRASVTATTTSTSTTCNSSNNAYSEKITINPSLSTVHQQQQQMFATGVNSKFKLNCMLDHQHSDRCFASIDRPTNVQASQLPTLPNVIYAGPGIYPHQQHHLANQNTFISQHHNAQGSVASSRQLNALIDPVTQEQLLVCMLQQQMAAQHHQQQDKSQHQTHQSHQEANGLPNVPGLTKQQVEHLNNLHRQHYYHHLHQLHQMHHLHHLHHKCQQQQQQRQQQQSQAQHRSQAKAGQNVSAAATAAANADIYIGRSQFYAPRYDQIYANMAVNNDINKHKEEQKQQATILQQNGTKLVNKDQHNDAVNTSVQSQSSYSRMSPQQMSSASSGAAHNQVFPQTSSLRLAQINEHTNGLPVVNNNIKTSSMATVANNRQLSPNGTEARRVSYDVGATAGQQQHQQHRSPASSSPTSSRTSSNISPSSDASSSSTSSNSLSTSVPLTRSALRHTTKEPPNNRRQFSVERDLVNSQPMTATLSRVDSCRVMAQSSQLLDHRHQQQQMMRNPLQSQQPPMRTSKILNIGHQQSTNSASLAGSANHYQQANAQLEPRIAPTAESTNNATGLNRLTSNLANIRLNDNLAFTSLRAPKKSSSGSDLNTTLMAAVNGRSMNCRHASAYGNGGSARILSTSSSPDKARLMKAATTTTSSKSKTDVGNNDNNNGKSPVWFEYGCI